MIENDEEIDSGEDLREGAIPFVMPELPPSMTLGEILDLLELAENGGANPTHEQLKELGARLAMKADGYNDTLREMRDEAARFAEKIREFQKAKRRVESKRDRLQSIAIYHMEKHGLSRIPGEEYAMTIKTSKAVATKCEPQAALYPTHSRFIKISYEWKRKELGKALKEGDTAAAQVAEIAENKKPEFKPIERVK